jgi:hypothetical protein
MRVLFAVFYSSIETVFLNKVEKLLDVKHFTVSAIYSSAYIPPSVHLCQKCCNMSSAIAAVIHALNSSSIFTL